MADCYDFPQARGLEEALENIYDEFKVTHHDVREAKKAYAPVKRLVEEYKGQNSPHDPRLGKVIERGERLLSDAGEELIRVEERMQGMERVARDRIRRVPGKIAKARGSLAGKVSVTALEIELQWQEHREILELMKKVGSELERLLPSDQAASHVGKGSPSHEALEAWTAELQRLQQHNGYPFLFNFSWLPSELRRMVFKEWFDVGTIQIRGVECKGTTSHSKSHPVPASERRCMMIETFSGLIFSSDGRLMTRPFHKLRLNRLDDDISCEGGSDYSDSDYALYPIATFKCQQSRHMPNWYAHGVGLLEQDGIVLYDDMPQLPVNVLRANKEMCKEAREVLYGSNTFAFCTCAKQSVDKAPQDMSTPLVTSLFLRHLKRTGPSLTFITRLELHLTDELTIWRDPEWGHCDSVFNQIDISQWDTMVTFLEGLPKLKHLGLNIAGSLPEVRDYFRRHPGSGSSHVARLRQIPQKLTGLHVKYLGGPALIGSPGNHEHNADCYKAGPGHQWSCGMAQETLNLAAFITVLRHGLLDGGSKLGVRGIRAVWGSREPEPAKFLSLWLMAEIRDANGGTFDGDVKERSEDMAQFDIAYEDEYALGPVMDHPVIQKLAGRLEAMSRKRSSGRNVRRS